MYEKLDEISPFGDIEFQCNKYYNTDSKYMIKPFFIWGE